MNRGENLKFNKVKGVWEQSAEEHNWGLRGGK
jgi:hypothetical protein